LTDRSPILVDKRLESLRELALRMGHLAEAILAKSLRAVWERNADLAQQVREDDLEIDRLDVLIDQAVLELLALQAPVARDLRQVIAIKTMAMDLERVGDLARNIAKSAIRLRERTRIPMPPLLLTLADDSQRLLANALAAFADRDAERARAVLAGDDQVDADEDAVIRAAIEEIRTRPAISEQAVDLIFIAKNLERVADHATNIAEDVVLAEESVNLKHAAKLGG
jgi:phosphate transport system protein